MAERRVFKPQTGPVARAFEKAWCEHCSRHGDPSDASGCWILFAAAIYDAEAPDYPEAWVIGEDGPECRAFEARPFPPDSPDHPDYGRGFLDAVAGEIVPLDAGFYYCCGFSAGLHAQAVFDRAHVLVARGGVGIFAEGAR
ncbi:hypothetical protein CCR94_16445 [Rhodoblastus sphagnicola]|uniref:Uncharacterized protein n=1 Tax=Rhodoblastus sphagnicola TaxID=333368 RepID=A0A2S6N2Z8_9HYPH|nr:hypothetical protein [Rhodoblastus sphagnicola]MBB4199087.1 hypothetical protein [Rhodoblastus sphagnicola]PPQ28979.1 hypothetical protein CCR94_16445 [Rhodoblastus sphagnicola]